MDQIDEISCVNVSSKDDVGASIISKASRFFDLAFSEGSAVSSLWTVVEDL